VAEGDNMGDRDFNLWLSGFRDSIADYGYYIDFPKVHRNVDAIKVELNILNSLIGSKDIENDFEALMSRYPEVLKCIPLLLAVRQNEIYAIDGDGEFLYNFKKPNVSVEQYKVFMRKTGLFDLISNHLLNNLVDYATGVETGLDSNGRKNRGGHLMENLVESFIKKAGFIRDDTYFKEMYIHEITEKWGIDLSAISNSGKMEKRFDFVIKTNSMIYGIETNFYGSGGSKLNETARSYKTLALETDTIDGFTFVWFTDGKGWTSARNNLEETFDVMPHIYNIRDMENGIIGEVFK
jgi:type II restriction enzyme